MAQRTTFTILLPKLSRPVDDFTDLCDAVNAGIGGNPTIFVTPAPRLTDVMAAKDALVTANVPDNLANDASRIVLKQRKVELLELLRQLAAYVIGVAKGDRYTASLSGFELSKEETTPKQQSKIIIKDTKPGPGDGEATIRLASRGGFDMFIVELKMPDNSWRMIGAFTLSKFILKGLPLGNSNIRITGYKSDVPGTVDGSVIQTVVKAL